MEINGEEYVIETITPAEATERLRAMGMPMSPDTLRAGIDQGVYSFGDVIRCEKGPKYIIYVKKFNDWYVRSGGERSRHERGHFRQRRL